MAGSIRQQKLHELGDHANAANERNRSEKIQPRGAQRLARADDGDHLKEAAAAVFFCNHGSWKA